jgi:hypothetical protein
MQVQVRLCSINTGLANTQTLSGSSSSIGWTVHCAVNSACGAMLCCPAGWHIFWFATMVCYFCLLTGAYCTTVCAAVVQLQAHHMHRHGSHAQLMLKHYGCLLASAAVIDPSSIALCPVCLGAAGHFHGTYLRQCTCPPRCSRAHTLFARLRLIQASVALYKPRHYFAHQRPMLRVVCGAPPLI